MSDRMTAEEALAEAWATMDLNETKFAQFQAERAGRVERHGPEDSGRYEGYVIEAAELIARLAKRGYALHPIKIDEAAVETAAKQAFCEKAGQHQLVTYLRAEWINQSRAIITAYHEALVRTR